MNVFMAFINITYKFAVTVNKNIGKYPFLEGIRTVLSTSYRYFYFYLIDLYESSHPTEEMVQNALSVKEHRTELKAVYDMLEDEKSKEVFKSILIFRATKKRKHLPPFSLKDQYNPKDIITLSNSEIFVDGGAYNGFDSIRIFRKLGYKRIYFFEPSPNNFMVLKKTIERNRLKNVDVLNMGLWSKKDTLSFNDDSSACASINKTGTSRIDVESIDNICVCGATFIKMDVEGAELDALKGAEKTIRIYKPKLAICIYHKPEHMYQIALYIKELVPEYKIYVRHHLYNSSETVLYAVL